jgi:hypothetical protein
VKGGLLSWLSDPLAVDRLQRLVDDKDADERRTAKLAVERIVGYWTLFGHWQPTLHDVRRCAVAIEQLADIGLRAFAYELVVQRPTELAGPLQARLARFSRAGGPTMRRLFAITAQRAVDQLPYTERLVRAREPIGWNARRVVRAFGAGNPAQRYSEA